MDAKNLADLYDLPLLEWSSIEARLRDGVPQAPGEGGPNRHTVWLATLNRDGSPHLTGIGALWADGSWWFETGESSRKGKNLAHDPRCTMSVATDVFDLVMEGTAQIVSDPAAVAARAAEWSAGGWPAQVDESGVAITAEYSAPSAGSPPWRVYRFTPHRATALATVAPGGATRWSFDGS
jgi:hypothetical protein